MSFYTDPLRYGVKILAEVDFAYDAPGITDFLVMHQDLETGTVWVEIYEDANGSYPFSIPGFDGWRQFPIRRRHDLTNALHNSSWRWANQSVQRRHEHLLGSLYLKASAQ